MSSENILPLSLVFIAPIFSHHLFFSVFIRKKIICNLSFIPLQSGVDLGVRNKGHSHDSLEKSCLYPLVSPVKEERLAQPIRSHFQVS